MIEKRDGKTGRGPHLLNRRELNHFHQWKQIFLLSDVLGDPSQWESFREKFNRTGTKSLFMIPFYSDITEEDVGRTDQIVEFYVGSYDNITEDNKHRMIDMFTDSGFSF